jgi:hypothetical protein
MLWHQPQGSGGCIAHLHAAWPGLTAGEVQATACDLLPSEVQDFAMAAASEHQQAHGGHPDRIRALQRVQRRPNADQLIVPQHPGIGLLPVPGDALARVAFR